MTNGCILVKKKRLLLVSWVSSLLLILLSLQLSSCGITLFSVSCSGSNISCITPTVIPNGLALSATASAITKSKPLLIDSLRQAGTNGWHNQSGAKTSCLFRDGAYYVTNDYSPAGTYGCDSPALHYSDMAIKVDITLISGYEAGIVFRIDPTFSEMYACDITSQGEADLRVFGENGIATILIPATVNKAIRGVRQKNALLVVARGEDFQIFVNSVFIGEAHDDTLASGSLGMATGNYSSVKTQASFSNIVVYPV